jgi:hypothetical protein
MDEVLGRLRAQCRDLFEKDLEVISEKLGYSAPHYREKIGEWLIILRDLGHDAINLANDLERVSRILLDLQHAIEESHVQTGSSYREPR